MSQSLSNRTVEFASGTTGSMPFNLESSNSYYYPVVQMVPGELGGMSVYQLAAAASTNATTVKTTPGMVYGFSLFHVDATPVYVTFYDVSSTPTPDTTTIKMKCGVQAAATAALGYGDSVQWPHGIVFSTGISIAVHAGIATSTALTASEVLFTMWYK